MNPPKQKLRSPVYREEGHTYLLASLISFAGTVILTRLFLEITGYPQLGGGTLHIAHVLWGGLILFLAALLPLILANRWAFSLSAILSGVGVGLFIDELGKFITQTNDYFYPPAAPIIYAFFLLTVLLYLQLRKRNDTDPRHRLYHVLNDLTEILEGDLDQREMQRIESHLTEVTRQQTNPDLKNMSAALLQYLQHGNIEIVPARLSFLERLNEAIDAALTKRISKRLFKNLLAAALALAGGLACLELIVVFQAYFVDGSFLEYILQAGFIQGEVRSLAGASWFIIHLIFQGLVGLSSFIAAALLWANRDRQAIAYGTVCMVLSLTAVNLLAFFVDQFSAAAIAIYQLGVLLSLSYYRRQYVPAEK